jgi:hypothetical protein
MEEETEQETFRKGSPCLWGSACFIEEKERMVPEEGLEPSSAFNVCRV